MEAGALDEGRWIPPFLPQSMRNIVETHALDTNRLRVTFDYTPGDLGRITQECRRIEQSVSSTLRFECTGWGLPIEIQLEPSGKGLVVSRHDT